MFYSTNQSYHWKLNQSEVAISGRLANQIVRIKPIRRGVTCNTSASEQYIIFSFFSFHFFLFFLFFFSFHLFFIFLIFFYISLIISDIPRDFLRAR
jgi:ABC-type bacteriocin/lantibiotic exporter with double-glycine peptidase domain